MNIIVEKDIKRAATRSESPDPIDIHVGSRLRMRRNLIGWSQDQLGKALGLTFQQIQKYERGINRMGSSRLFQVSKILSVPVAYFFEEIPSPADIQQQPGFAEGKQEPLEKAPLQEITDHDIMHRRETLDLVRSYYSIQDLKKRRKIFELMRLMAEEE